MGVDPEHLDLILDHLKLIQIWLSTYRKFNLLG
jgi:hypothetical protein